MIGDENVLPVGGVIAALVFALVALWQVNERLANPTAPGTARFSRLDGVGELRAATLSDPAEATIEERTGFIDGCTARRKLQTSVGNGWQMYDAQATADACACALRILASRSSRLEWLAYVGDERNDSTSRSAVDARLEQLGMAAPRRRALLQDWRNNRLQVARDCKP